MNIEEYNSKPLRQKIENAIRSTLVIGNKQSISIAVYKIMDEIKQEYEKERK